MIRLILVLVYILLFFIVSFPLFLIEWLIGKFNPAKRDLSCLHIVQSVLRTIGKLAGMQTTYLGLENIPKDQAVLYVGNHRGYFDVVATYPMCPNLTGYIAKIEIRKVPVLKSWMDRLYCLFLDRDDIKAGLKLILTAIDYVKKGTSIFVFPEGTRSKTDQMLPFKEGSMKVASKSGCLIIPVAISGTSAILEDHYPLIRSSKVIVQYGEPIDPKALTKEEQKFLGAYVQGKIQEMLDQHFI